MLQLKSNIEFKRDNETIYIFKYIVDVAISKSWDNITSTATIQIPNRFRDKNKEVKLTFQRGDQVIIKLGYYPDLITEFTGYISNVKNDNIITLSCEDNMYILKQRNIRNYSARNLTLKSFVDGLFTNAGVNYDVRYIDPDLKIGAYRISNSNVCEALHSLRKFGLFPKFDGDTLIIDTPYLITENETTIETKTKNFVFQKNIIDDSLEYRLTSDVSVVIKGISYQANNTTIERYAYYDSTGEIKTSSEAQTGNQITFLTRGLTSSELDDIIKTKLPASNYQGYYGSFNTFGRPYVEPSFYANIIDKKFPERDGRYIIKAVDKSFGNSGFRQSITLGAQS